MSSITPGVNVPERSIGEGSAEFGRDSDMRTPPIGGCVERTLRTSQGRLPEVQVRLLEIPQLPPGDQFPEGLRRGDLPSLQQPEHEVAVGGGELLNDGVGPELAR